MTLATRWYEKGWELLYRLNPAWLGGWPGGRACALSRIRTLQECGGCLRVNDPFLPSRTARGRDSVPGTDRPSGGKRRALAPYLGSLGGLSSDPPASRWHPRDPPRIGDWSGFPRASHSFHRWCRLNYTPRERSPCAL